MGDKINIYLDDIRGLDTEQTGGSLWLEHDRYDPNLTTEWHVVRTVSECLDLLVKHHGNVAVLSLDHDLGMYAVEQPGKLVVLGAMAGGPEHTGYDVLLWLEEQIALHLNVAVLPDEIRVHSENWAAKGKMLQAVESIAKKCDALRVQRRREREEALLKQGPGELKERTRLVEGYMPGGGDVPCLLVVHDDPKEKA